MMCSAACEYIAKHAACQQGCSQCLLEQLEDIVSLLPEGAALDKLLSCCSTALDLPFACPLLPGAMRHELLQVLSDLENSVQHDEVGAKARGPCMAVLQTISKACACLKCIGHNVSSAGRMQQS